MRFADMIDGASKQLGLFDIRLGARRRRRWSDEVKRQIVAESCAPGAVVSEVARRHGLSPQQLSTWRKAARDGEIVLPADAAEMTAQPHDGAAMAWVADTPAPVSPEN